MVAPAAVTGGETRKRISSDAKEYCRRGDGRVLLALSGLVRAGDLDDGAATRVVMCRGLSFPMGK